jgi:hypothetical protein
VFFADCKAQCGHGKWLPWLEREFGWDERTAQRYLGVHQLAAKYDTVSDFDIPMRGLYLLARPSTPEEARQAVVEAESVPPAKFGARRAGRSDRREGGYPPDRPQGICPTAGRPGVGRFKGKLALVGRCRDVRVFELRRPVPPLKCTVGRAALRAGWGAGVRRTRGWRRRARGWTPGPRRGGVVGGRPWSPP